jgi:hypothetical protein
MSSCLNGDRAGRARALYSARAIASKEDRTSMSYSLLMLFYVHSCDPQYIQYACGKLLSFVLRSIFSHGFLIWIALCYLMFLWHMKHRKLKRTRSYIHSCCYVSFSWVSSIYMFLLATVYSIVSWDYLSTYIYCVWGFFTSTL